MDDLAQRIRDVLIAGGAIYVLGIITGLLATWII
jgi:hypothetical protein